MKRKGLFDNNFAFPCQNTDQPSLTGSMKAMPEKMIIFLNLVTIMIQSLRAVTGLVLCCVSVWQLLKCALLDII